MAATEQTPENTTTRSEKDWHVRVPPIRSVATDQAWSWLNKGWHDYQKSWSYGLFFGGAMQLAGFSWFCY